MLDEPTSGLDARGADALAGLLCELRDEGRALAVVTHDLAFAEQVADEVLVVDDGRGRQSGDVRGVLNALLAEWDGESGAI